MATADELVSAAERAVAPDRLAVGRLLDRYLIGIDSHRVDEEWAAALFDAGVAVEFPVGRHEGIAGLVEFHCAALAKFTRTQHLNSPAVVEVDGDRAALSANVIATQVLPSGGLFTAGTSASGEAIRTPAGWRLRRLSFRLVWRSGEPPVTG